MLTMTLLTGESISKHTQPLQMHACLSVGFSGSRLHILGAASAHPACVAYSHFTSALGSSGAEFIMELENVVGLIFSGLGQL